MAIKDLETNKNVLPSKYEKISVVILCEELRYTSEDKHVIDTALALVNYGHKVVIFANKNDLRREYNKIKRKLEVVIIGKFIPKSIFGYFQNPLLCLWSIYAAVFASIFKPKGNTNIMFCDKNIFALPILNLLGSYKIIQFHNLYNFTQLKNTETEKIKLPKSWIDLRSINFVNEVLLPNKASRNIFEENYNLPVKKTILYPCICTSHSTSARSKQLYVPIPKRFLLPNLPINSVIFVLFGDYRPSSNFELVINALAILTRKVRKHNITKIQLVIAGNYSKKNKEQYKYCAQLMHLAKKYNLLKNITFLNSLHSVAKKSLLEYCIAMIHTAVSNIYDRNVLEAMSFSKPVIATNSAFSLEVLEHGITGYILSPEPIRFAEIMHEIIYNPTTSKMIGEAAFMEYQKKYSFPKFAKVINRLVMKYNVKSYIENKNQLKRNRVGLCNYRNREIVEKYMDTEITVKSVNESNPIGLVNVS